VRKVWKSVNIWWSYGQEFHVLFFFDSQCRWRKVIKDVWWSGWIWMFLLAHQGSPGQRAIKWSCVCCLLLIYHMQCITWYTHTHARLMALCPVLPGWDDTRKVKPIWILLKQETVSGSGISWDTCKSVPHSRQITTSAPHHSSFLQAMPFLAPNQQHQSTEGTLPVIKYGI